MWPKVEIRVYGSLIANGTLDQRITMRPYYNQSFIDGNYSSYLKFDSDGYLTFLASSSKYEQIYMGSNDASINNDLRSICKDFGYLGDANVTSSIKKID